MVHGQHVARSNEFVYPVPVARNAFFPFFHTASASPSQPHIPNELMSLECMKVALIPVFSCERETIENYVKNYSKKLPAKHVSAWFATNKARKVVNQTNDLPHTAHIHLATRRVHTAHSIWCAEHQQLHIQVHVQSSSVAAMTPTSPSPSP